MSGSSIAKLVLYSIITPFDTFQISYRVVPYVIGCGDISIGQSVVIMFSGMTMVSVKLPITRHETFISFSILT